MKKTIYIIVVFLFILLIIAPLAYTLGSVFIGNTSLSENLQQINRESFSLLGRSMIVASSIAILSTSFGTILGFLLYRTRVKYRSFFKLALLIPLFISPYILAVAWKDLFFVVTNSTHAVSSYFGVILVLTSIYTPLAMLIIGSALSNINPQLEESGLMLTGFHKVLFRITLPLIKPALLSSFILIFIFSISEFSVPAFLGTELFTTEIFTQFSAFYNHSLAILQSVLLIAICILLLFSEAKYISEAPFLSIGSKGTYTGLYNLKWKNRFSFLFLSLWFFIFVVLPFIILIIQSFSNGTAAFLHAFKLLLPTFGNSIVLALTGALIIVFVGFTSAYFSASQSKIVLKKSFDRLLLIVFAIPSTILGISLIKFYNQPGLDFIYAGFSIIIIAYVGKFSFIAAKIIGNALKQIPYSLVEAAQMHGIRSFSRLSKIIIPLIMPAVFVSFIISFIFSLGELGTTIMVYPPGTEIMPIKVFTIMANAPQSLTSSMTLIVFSVTLLIITGFYLVFKLLKNKYHYAID